MALPEQPPNPDFLEYALGEFDDGTHRERLASLGGSERRVNEWVAAIEAWTIMELRLDEEIEGLELIMFGLDGPKAFDELTLLVHAYVKAPALEAGDPGPSVVEVPAADGYEAINVRYQPWDLELHAADLAYATRTCWVHLDNDDHALLTVRHAVQQTYRSPPFAKLDDGSIAPLRWHAPDCLDAAVLDGPTPQGFSWLTIAPPSVQASVTVHRKPGAAGATVLAANRTFGTVTSGVPHLFFLDSSFVRGDSGSLVTLDRTDEGAGLYLGRLRTSGGDLGLCQGLHQLDAQFQKNHGAKGLCVDDDPGQH